MSLIPQIYVTSCVYKQPQSYKPSGHSHTRALAPGVTDVPFTQTLIHVNLHTQLITCSRNGQPCMPKHSELHSGRA